MSREDPLQEKIGDLARDHRAIVALLEELVEHSALEGLLGRVQRLRVLLLSHFAQEQLPGGFYDAMRARTAADPQELDALIREHQSILADVKALIDRLHGASPGDEPGITSDLQQLVDFIREHERKEQALLKRLPGAPPTDAP